MKIKQPILLLLAVSLSTISVAQPPNCNTFEISGTLYGGPTDWMGINGIIDESAYVGLGAIGMNRPQNTFENGILYHLGLYSRDFCKSDSTAFVGSNKNGQDPSTWTTGFMQVQGKSDIIDSYVHARRLGSSLTDPLVVYCGMAKATNNGQAFWSAEFFAECLSGQQAPFNCQGACHTRWEFDGQGNVLTVGDMIIAVAFDNNQLQTVDLRIWVTREDFETIHPANFGFGTAFNGATNNAIIGYGQIINLAFCAAASPQGAMAPPWGSLNGQCNTITTYQSAQFTEVGVDLTALGISPASIPGNNNCAPPFCSVLFKTRTSLSFTSELKDYAGPYAFQWPDELPATITGDTLRCNTSSVTLVAQPFIEYAGYEWQDETGNVISTDYMAVASTPGTYTLFTDPFGGCNLSAQAHFVVLGAPCAANDSFTVYSNQLLNGNVLTNDSDPDDDLQELTVSLVQGPGHGTLILQPDGTFIYTPAGGYVGIDSFMYRVCDLTTPEALCDEGLVFIEVQMTLPLDFLGFTAQINTRQHVTLEWWTADEVHITAFAVQRALDTRSFETIGSIASNQQPGGGGRYRFVDQLPGSGDLYYRIQAVESDGNTINSAIRHLRIPGSLTTRMYPNPVSDLLFVSIPDGISPTTFHISIYTIHGLLLKDLEVNVSGVSEIDVNGLLPGEYLVHVRAQQYSHWDRISVMH